MTSHQPSFDVEYLFIDGRYLRDACDGYMHSLFNVPSDINLEMVKQAFGAKKAFYYDCADDVKRDTEDDTAFRIRVERQNEQFDQISLIPGFHVRLGTVTGSKRRRLRQKEVDVQLAVDMLTHAFRQNMTRATLLSGDLDFRPVVSSLVDSGMWVRVAGKPSTSSKELYRAADAVNKITLDHVYNWSTEAFRRAHHLPVRELTKFNAHPLHASEFRKAGTVCGFKIRMLADAVVIFRYHDNLDLIVSGEELDFIERYITIQIGRTDWD